MVGGIIFIIGIFFLSIWTIYKINQNINRPKIWKGCTYCTYCDQEYSQAGLEPSIYICPTCGRNTKTGYSFTYKDGKRQLRNLEGELIDKEM